ncbi:hypothetical protein FRC02_003819 [Tulasnella sp. 418]|nr:hypothetical protein FRC02_003819 [Tulasnella sp. 418]
MSGSFLSTHPEPATTPSHTPSPPPSESLQSIYLPLKRTYAFYLALDPLGDQLHGEPSVLPNESTVPTTTAQVPPLHNRRRARTPRIKGQKPTRSSQRIQRIMEKKRRLQSQPEPKETKPAKRRKIKQ